MAVRFLEGPSKMLHFHVIFYCIQAQLVHTRLFPDWVKSSVRAICGSAVDPVHAALAEAPGLHVLPC